MNMSDKTKNNAEKIAGKAKESLGKVTGNEDLEAEGKAEQAKADLKNAAEKVKDALKD